MAPATPARSLVKVECVGDRSAVKAVKAMFPTRSWLFGQLLGEARIGVTLSSAGKRRSRGDLGHGAGEIVTSSKLA
jgi:hypothetical protein